MIPFSGNIQSFFRWGFSGFAVFPTTAGSSICTEVDWAPSRPTRFLEPVHAVTEECSCGALELGVQMGSAALQWQNAMKSWRFDECSWKKSLLVEKYARSPGQFAEYSHYIYSLHYIIYCSGASQTPSLQVPLTGGRWMTRWHRCISQPLKTGWATMFESTARWVGWWGGGVGNVLTLHTGGFNDEFIRRRWDSLQL